MQNGSRRPARPRTPNELQRWNYSDETSPDPRKYKDPATCTVKGRLPIWSLQQPPIEFLLVGKRRNACEAARRNDTADVAQLVEHHLAKVDVASSNLVVRSQGTVKASIPRNPAYTVGWPRGEAAACKAVYTGSNPVPTSVKTMSSGFCWMHGRLAQR